MIDLRRRLRNAIEGILTGALGAGADEPLLEEALRLESPREAAHGDLTSVAAMRLPKVLRKPPRAIAEALIAELQKAPELAGVFAKIEPAGPGFINFTLSAEWVARVAAEAFADERLGVPKADKPRTAVIDFSAPNAAKPMHIGHIRSTVLGDSLQRVLRFLGHRVIGDNHLGDWGTQFGMIVCGIKTQGLADRVETLSIDDIEVIYREVSDAAERDEAAAEAARAEVVKLQAGDPENVRLWQAVMSVSRAELDATYARLNVTFDETLGESYYNDVLADVAADLKAKGIARESEGALVIFYENDKYPPFLVQKRDGAFLYSTTDLATIRHRVQTWHADWMIYVVDSRQQLHFSQLFEAARMWGYGTVQFENPWFGSILGDDGRPFRTRAGGVVRLSDVLDEAESRAMAIVEEKNPELSDEQKKNIARVVGIGALKYADLSQNRTSDYVFSWEKMLALIGNTAPYMQYAYARVRSIFRKGGLDETALMTEHTAYVLETPQEMELAKALLNFDETIHLAAEQLRPNFLSAYLYDLANRFSAFYDQCPVLKAPTQGLLRSRLMLCDHTARVIRLGLELLGIEVVEQM